MSKSKFSIFASPLLCLGLLGGMVAEESTHLQPTDVGPYHARAKATIEAWPRTIPDGEWTTTQDSKLPDSADKLLHSNAVINRGYISRKIQVNGFPTQASLLIVQCTDSRDMAGHYPPICYPAAGRALVSAERFDITIAGTPVHGVEYQFQFYDGVQSTRQSVYDFFIVPGKGIVPDMDSVRKAAKDYQARYYGAAQFQVLVDADIPREKRELIFKSIIGANPGVFEALNTVGAQ